MIFISIVAMTFFMASESTLDDAKEAVELACTAPEAVECEGCTETDCFEVSYVLSVLESYGVTELPSLTFADDVDGQEVAWTLGFVIVKSPLLL